MAENTAQNPYVNKVSYFGQTLIDLTGDQVTPSDLLHGVTAHNRSGAPITGIMPNNGTITRAISNKNDSVSIPVGYHNGSGTVTIDADEKAKLIAQNIRSGIEILGVTGILNPRPEWLSNGDNAAWEYAYMNRNVDWDTILSTRNYGDGNATFVGFSMSSEDRASASGIFLAVRSIFGLDYALIYYTPNISPIPIYATAAGIYVFQYYDNIASVRCATGWNNVAVPLAANTASCIFFYGAEDLTQVAAGTPLAFGDYRRAPKGSITINANGTYRNLWQYAEVIINVPTSGTEEEATVESNTLVFDGDTAVDGNTLILALEAEVEDKTLVILGASGSDATIDGNTLTVNGTADGETLHLDATVNDNILMI